MSRKEGYGSIMRVRPTHERHKLPWVADVVELTPTRSLDLFTRGVSA